MYFVWLPLLLLLFSANVQSYEFPVEIFEYVNDEKVVAFINESDIDASTSWIPSDGAPPVTIANVVNAIRKYIAPDPKLSGATFSEIELKQIPHHEKHWHYLVKMKSRTGGHAHYHYFVVLMSGKIIPALKEPESFK